VLGSFRRGVSSSPVGGSSSSPCGSDVNGSIENDWWKRWALSRKSW
jgi:hypothetical protein